MKFKLLIAALTLTSVSFAQSIEERRKIVSENDVKALSQIKTELKHENDLREVRILSYLRSNPTVKRIVSDSVSTREIYDVVDGQVQYFSTSNVGSARTARANKLYNNGGMNLNIQGQGMEAVVWDGGNVRRTHKGFAGNRVTNVDGNVSDSHATHVAGTIIANNFVDGSVTANDIQGIAFQGTVKSYNWNSDYLEVNDEIELGMLVSNHSYYSGPIGKWVFGAYDSRARQMDAMTFASPYYLPVTAAGNDRTVSTDTDSFTIEQLNLKGGYELIKGMQTAKNFLTVGAVYNVTNYTSPNSVQMSTFSSWGPTDDGRIKPEIVAKGVSVKSTGSTSNTAVMSSQGTSMASPAIAGVALLLQQYYKSLNPNYMYAATLKGLIMHTADEAGMSDTTNLPADGPDYRFGWGLVNTERAAQLILAKTNNTAVLDELELTTASNTYTKTVSVTGNDKLMVSISWTDPAYPSANNGTINPTTKYLVNDLDVRVTKDGVTYYPWTLNPTNPSASAVRNADNNRDNFEKIQVDNASGTYTITVTHKGTLTNNSQKFTLIASGNQLNLSDKDFSFNSESITVYPNPTSDILNFTVGNSVDVSNVVISDLSGKTINTKYIVGQNNINVSHLQSGVYFAKFITQGNVIVKKFMKK